MSKHWETSAQNKNLSIPERALTQRCFASRGIGSVTVSSE